MPTTQRYARSKARCIKPINPSRQPLFEARRKARPRRRFDHVKLSPPEYLTLETDAIWPPVSEPASLATQCRVKFLIARQRALRATAITAVCIFLLICWAFAVIWLNSLFAHP
jgi:hypothetical protein